MVLHTVRTHGTYYTNSGSQHIYRVHAQCTQPIEVNNRPPTDDALVLDNDQFLNMQTVGEVKF